MRKIVNDDSPPAISRDLDEEGYSAWGKSIVEKVLGTRSKEEVELLEDELRSLLSSHPEDASNLLQQLVLKLTQEQERITEDGQNFYIHPWVSNALFHLILKHDPELALEFDNLVDPNGYSENELLAIEALQAEGKLAIALEHYPSIPENNRRHAIVALAENCSIGDLEIMVEWLDTQSDFEREMFAHCMPAELLPKFDEFEKWPYKDVLGDVINGGRAKVLLPELEGVTSVEEAKAKLDGFESLPGFNEPFELPEWGVISHRYMLECAWFEKHLREHPEDVLWAVEAMEAFGDQAIAYTIGEIYDDQSPKDAMAFAERVPDRYTKSAAQTILERWYQDDSQQASKYITEMRAGELRYQAALALARRLERGGHTDDDAGHWQRWADEEAK